METSKMREGALATGERALSHLIYLEEVEIGHSSVSVLRSSS